MYCNVKYVCICTYMFVEKRTLGDNGSWIQVDVRRFPYALFFESSSLSEVTVLFQSVLKPPTIQNLRNYCRPPQDCLTWSLKAFSRFVSFVFLHSNHTFDTSFNSWTIFLHVPNKHFMMNMLHFLLWNRKTLAARGAFRKFGDLLCPGEKKSNKNPYESKAVNPLRRHKDS